MTIEKFIEPHEIEVGGKTFIISKFPAVNARRIITQYIATGIPKVGDYNTNEELMLLLMTYVAVKNAEGKITVLKNRDLVDNHVIPEKGQDIEALEMLAKIEMASLDYNCAFFRNGWISNFFGDIAQKLPQWITKMLKDSLGQSSPQGTQHTNS